nr:nadh-ubiquinone oxidoreductase 12 kda subunit, mitochondrial [Quercus suber]
MCCYGLFIYETCGHCILSGTPLIRCQLAAKHQGKAGSPTCQPVPHPYRSWRFASLCVTCALARTELMAQLKHIQTLAGPTWKKKFNLDEPKLKIGIKDEQAGGGKEADSAFDGLILSPCSFRRANLNNPPYHLAAMPTPESASFKAAKPAVPPSFDGVNYDDNKQLKAAQDAVIREQWVQSMMARLIREEMGKCYYREGVNHLEKCGHLRERYLQQLQHSKIKGYMFEQQNYISEK